MQFIGKIIPNLSTKARTPSDSIYSFLLFLFFSPSSFNEQPFSRKFFNILPVRRTSGQFVNRAPLSFLPRQDRASSLKRAEPARTAIGLATVSHVFQRRDDTTGLSPARLTPRSHQPRITGGRLVPDVLVFHFRRGDIMRRGEIGQAKGKRNNSESCFLFLSLVWNVTISRRLRTSVRSNVSSCKLNSSRSRTCNKQKNCFFILQCLN